MICWVFHFTTFDDNVLAIGSPHFSFDKTANQSGRVRIYEYNGLVWQLKGNMSTLHGQKAYDGFGKYVS